MNTQMEVLQITSQDQHRKTDSLLILQHRFSCPRFITLCMLTNRFALKKLRIFRVRLQDRIIISTRVIFIFFKKYGRFKYFGNKNLIHE